MARLLIALAALAAPESAPSPPLTNIVVFLLDTVRPDRLHSYGGPAATAPVFDRIASLAERMRSHRVEELQQ